jgi:hypothetical protein
MVPPARNFFWLINYYFGIARSHMGIIAQKLLKFIPENIKEQ